MSIEAAAPTAGAPNATPAPDATAPGSAPGGTPNAASDKDKERDLFSEKLELLARKERMTYRKHQEIKAKEREIAEKEARYAKIEEARSKAKQNPLDALREMGLSYDEITQYMLNGGKPTEANEIQSVRGELEALRKQLDDEKKASDLRAQSERTAAETQAIEDFKGEIASFVEQNKDKYELLSLRGTAVEDVWNAINDAWTISYTAWARYKEGQPPKPMTISEGVEAVEGFYEKEIERLTQAKKIQAKLNPPKDPNAQKNPAKAPSPTLNNQMTSSAAPSLLSAKTEDDRIKRALAKLSGE